MTDISVSPNLAAATKRIGRGYNVVWCEPSSTSNMDKVLRVAVFVPVGHASSTSIGIPALKDTSDTLNVKLGSIDSAEDVTGKII